MRPVYQFSQNSVQPIMPENAQQLYGQTLPNDLTLSQPQHIEMQWFIALVCIPQMR